MISVILFFILAWLLTILFQSHYFLFKISHFSLPLLGLILILFIISFINSFIIFFWEMPLIQAPHFCNNLMAKEISLFLKEAIYKEFQSPLLQDINVPRHKHLNY